MLITPERERRKPAWVALVEILLRLEEQPDHWPVGRTTFQKIAWGTDAESVLDLPKLRNAKTRANTND